MANLSDNPLISIVVPTYNRVVLLRKAIASVLVQTYKNWELFVVDDGSTDDTAETINSLTDPRIHLLAMPHSGNVAALRNAGAKVGSGEWITFLDSDDEWVLNKLEIQLCGLLHEKKRWSYGGFTMIDEMSRAITGKSKRCQFISGWIAGPLITTEVAVNIGSLMIRREFFNEVGGFDAEPKLIYREDYELALRLALREEVLAIPGVLVLVREHPSRSTNFLSDGHERTVFVYRYFLHSRPVNRLARLARKRIGYHLAEIAVNCMKNRKYLSAASDLVKAFVNGDSIRHLLSAIRRGLAV